MGQCHGRAVERRQIEVPRMHSPEFSPFPGAACLVGSAEYLASLCQYVKKCTTQFSLDIELNVFAYEHVHSRCAASDFC